MTTAVFPGTFDPVTAGHVDIVTRAHAITGHVVVALAHNAAKNPLLDVQTRTRLAREALIHLPGVEVHVVDGLIADFCQQFDTPVIVKGLRGGADYDYERPMALMNRSLAGVETLFITGDPALAHVASSLVRDVARHGGDISAMVPPGVEDVVRAAFDQAG